MLAVKSTHKRKRSSSRRDAKHAGSSALQGGGAIVSLLKGKGRAVDADHTEGRVLSIVKSHPFAHHLSVVLPVSEEGKAGVSDLVKRLPDPSRCKAYRARISPCLFLDPLFVSSYIKRGALTVLSAGDLDQDDVLCVDGHGTMHLSLTKDTYQTLGLQGQAYKQSQTSSGRAGDRNSGKAQRFVVSIDLRASHFTAGKPGYDRTAARLKAWDLARGDDDHHGSWDVMMAWCNDDAESLGDDIHFPPRYVTPGSAQVVGARQSVDVTEDVWVPSVEPDSVFLRGWTEPWMTTIDAHRLEWDSWLERLTEWSEWCALASCAAECIRTFARADELNAYQVAEPRRASQIVVVRYTGFLSAAMGQEVVRAVQSFVGPQQTFASVHSTGFADAPVCWTKEARTMAAAASTAVSTKQDKGALSGASDDDSSSSQDEDDSGPETGAKARRKRNKQKQKRSYNNPLHQGHQVRNASSACSASGWQTLSFCDGSSKDCIVIENVGDTMRS